MSLLDRMEARFKWAIGYWEGEYGKRMYQRHRAILRKVLEARRMPKAHMAIPKDKRKG